MTTYMTLQELHHRQAVHRREAEIRRLAQLARCDAEPARRRWRPWT